MPHDLATTNGRPAMFYSGETPWHQLGTHLEEPATAAEAIEAAGLDYAIDLCPLVTECGLPVAKRRAVVRRDTRQVLGTVGAGYRAIQNRAAFGFLDDLVGEGQLRFHTAGALGQGERVWMLVQLPGEIVVGRDDVTEKHLLLTTSHDGSSSLRLFYTSIRVVCQNTLTLASRRGRGQGVTIHHRGRLGDRLEHARRVLGIAEEAFTEYGEQARLLAQRAVSPSEVDAYYRALYPDRPDEKRGRSNAIRERLQQLFEMGRGQDLEAAQGTAWGLLNSVTEFADYHRTSRGPDPKQRAERRLASAWFESGARLKRQAFEQALGLAS